MSQKSRKFSFDKYNAYMDLIEKEIDRLESSSLSSSSSSCSDFLQELSTLDIPCELICVDPAGCAACRANARCPSVNQIVHGSAELAERDPDDLPPSYEQVMIDCDPQKYM